MAVSAHDTKPLWRSLVRRVRGRRRRIILAGAVVLLALAGTVWAGPLETNAKAFLLISQLVPQFPVKPLDALTNAPVHTHITLASPHGTIVADLFRPVPRFGAVQPHSEPAVVLAMGVATDARAKTLLLSFAQTASRLGYVVMWPRLRALDRGQLGFESPDTFVRSVQYLRRLRVVAPGRVSIMGLSVGSSLGFVAATDPRIRSDVRALVFFGGDYDIAEQLVSLASHTMVLQGKIVPWSPDPQATLYARKMLRAMHVPGLAHVLAARTRAQAEALLRAAPPPELAEIRADSPSHHLTAFKTPIFILDDRGDAFVPYVQSLRMERVLPPKLVRAFLISNLFQHTHPRSIVSLAGIKEATNLYGFLRAALGFTG